MKVALLLPLLPKLLLFKGPSRSRRRREESVDGGGESGDFGVGLEEVVVAAESALVLEGVGCMWALYVCGNHIVT